MDLARLGFSYYSLCVAVKDGGSWSQSIILLKGSVSFACEQCQSLKRCSVSSRHDNIHLCEAPLLLPSLDSKPSYLLFLLLVFTQKVHE